MPAGGSRRQATPQEISGLDLISIRSSDYNSRARTDVIPLLARPLGRVLDVGCGEGKAAELLRERGATEIVGIELDESAGTAARGRYDEVLIASADAELPWTAARFDTILCYDVLEHLYDPWSVLNEVRRMLAPGGQLHISVPNARHRSLVFPLLFKGRFSYSPQGLLDVTHIRFFTRFEMERALHVAGFDVVSVATPCPVRHSARLLRLLTQERLLAFTSSHWFLLATHAPQGRGASAGP